MLRLVNVNKSDEALTVRQRMLNVIRDKILMVKQRMLTKQIYTVASALYSSCGHSSVQGDVHLSEKE